MIEPRKAYPAWIRISAVGLFALLFALAAYALIDWGLGEHNAAGSISLTFLLVLPAALSAFLSYATDPSGTRSYSHHLIVPSAMVAIALLAGFVLLQEGVICLVILAPLWLVAGISGSSVTYLARRRLRERGRLYSSALLLLPFLSAQLEWVHPPQETWFTVQRETIVDARPEQVWPALVSIPHIAADEGQWNIAQDILGIPRPTSAVAANRDGDWIRSAHWGPDVRFEEQVTLLAPGRALEWLFSFPDNSVQQHTDQHISPDGAHLRVHSGAYRLAPTLEGGTRIVLETTYVARTPLNSYASWWGELLLGGIQDNVLAIVKQRAEAP